MRKFAILLFLLCMLFLVGCKCGNVENTHNDKCRTCDESDRSDVLRSCMVCQLDDDHEGNHQCAHNHTWQ